MTQFFGLTNDNEYFSDHYLAEVLEGDLKDHASRDRTQALRALASEHRKLVQNPRGTSRAITSEDYIQNSVRWCDLVLQALGYPTEKTEFVLDSDGELPALVQLYGQDKKVRVLACIACPKQDVENADLEIEDPLTMPLQHDQFPRNRPPALHLQELTWEEVIDSEIMPMRNPPRWVLLISTSQMVLIDRHKWGQKRLLRVDFSELFDRSDAASLSAVACLFHRDSLEDLDGQNLLDRLDENSHKHAQGVSTDLKYALRESIELLANEAIYYLKNHLKVKVYENDEKMAADLGNECLRYMYRILFLFFLESRPELNLVPMQSDVYRQGYSLDHLRNLEVVDLVTDKARNGFYFHESLQKLFKLVREGTVEDEGQISQLEKATFQQREIDSRLFSNDSIPTLRRVRIRNFVLQQIIRGMSLSRNSQRQRRKRRGRISYTQLGVNQLGAVYEALLSYRGIFAEHDMYEVREGSKKDDVLEGTYLIRAEEIEEYTDEERVFDLDEQGRRVLRKHTKGDFLFRLAGRDRQKTASYYTPESLTRCVVKYALKERLHEGISAEEVLNLTVCEPALGSGSFLNEAVNQLAEKYLELRQQELNKRIPASELQNELRKVKQHIADRNVYGVDVNPVATELGELSLWLNCMHENGHVPWFGFQIKTGNSLLGASRSVYNIEDLRKKKAPKDEPIPVGGDDHPSLRSADSEGIYHFLLPYEDMLGHLAVKDETVESIAPGTRDSATEWRKKIRTKLTEDELVLLRSLSDVIDSLWETHTSQLAFDRNRTEDLLSVWGGTTESGSLQTRFDQKDQIHDEGIYNAGVLSASPYRRLKFVMDYWCALWFWPVGKLHELPSREEWFNEVFLVLTGKLQEPTKDDGELFSVTYLDPTGETLKEQLNKHGVLDWEQLVRVYPRISLVEEIAKKHRFHHWELEYSDIFYDRSGQGHDGFDLVLGNPPWVRPTFDEKGVASEFIPLVVIRKYSSPAVHNLLKDKLREDEKIKNAWIEEWEDLGALSNFLQSSQIYEALQSQQPDFYRAFIIQSWRISADLGTTGLLHPDSVFTDAKGSKFREQSYTRLRCHFQFQNEKRLFEDIAHGFVFGVNVYGAPSRSISFLHLSNLFSSLTIDGSFQSNGQGVIPSIKTADNHWNEQGHLKRIVEVNESTLKVMAACLEDETSDYRNARLMRIHSNDSLSILDKQRKYSRKLRNLGAHMMFSRMWEETGAVKDGTIKRDTCFVQDWSEFVYSGPHFFVANPFFKTPRENCKSKGDYDVIDLTQIPNDYRPRTNYVRACDEQEYLNRIQDIPWFKDQHSSADRSDSTFHKKIERPLEQSERKVTSQFRAISRLMVNPTSERTLIFSIIPNQACHIHSCHTTILHSHLQIVDLIGMSSTLLVDFGERVAGTINVTPNILRRLPIISLDSSTSRMVSALRVRTLGLNCLSSAYSPLWKEITNLAFQQQSIPLINQFQSDEWTTYDSAIRQDYFSNLSTMWERESALRSDRIRRQALVENDVLGAMIMGFTLSELISAYNEQFTTLDNYERNTWYDQCGRTIHTNRSNSTVVNIPSKAQKNDRRWSIDSPQRKESNIALGWEDVKNMREGTVSVEIEDNTMQGGPIYRTIEFQAPFVKCDRISDYETAWAEFERRFAHELKH